MSMTKKHLFLIIGVLVAAIFFSWNKEVLAACGDGICEEGQTPVSCPWDCHNYPDYSQYFINNPNVRSVFKEYLDKDTVNYFWSYISELENNGRIEIAEPIQLANCEAPTDCHEISLTDEEARKIHAAKAAHSIWLDKNNMLPWKLNNYSDSELQELFNKEILFGFWSSIYHFYSVVDYSPSDAYEYAKQFLQSNALNTSYLIINDLRKDFRHGISPADPTSTSYSLKEALTEYDSNGKRVSRTGCGTMTGIVDALLRSINIPADEVAGWYVQPDGQSHSSAFLSGIERILIHADDIYDAALRATPVDRLLMTFDYFNNNVRPCGEYTQCAGYATIRFDYLNAITYISNYTKNCCCKLTCPCGDSSCASCEEYFRSSYGDYLTEAELQDAIIRTQNMCGDLGGDVYPPATCGDGVIDIFDILAEVDFALEIKIPTDCQKAKGDVPTGSPPDCYVSDGSINILDVMTIIDQALGRPDCVGYCLEHVCNTPPSNQAPKLDSFTATLGNYYPNQGISFSFSATDDKDSLSQMKKYYQVWVSYNVNGFPEAAKLLLEWTEGTSYTIPSSGLKPNDMLQFKGKVRDTDGAYSNVVTEQCWHVVQNAQSTPMIKLDYPSVAPGTGCTIVNGTAAPSSGATITKINWNWGDGTSDDQWFPYLFPGYHTYYIPHPCYSDYFDVVATVYDSKGKSAQDGETVYVYTIPPPLCM